jgi:hypothetical protein
MNRKITSIPTYVSRPFAGSKAYWRQAQGQLWIVTHSLPLIAACWLSSTYFVDRGAIAHAGSRVGEPVAGILGGEENRHALQRFLFDIDDLAFHEFAAQCLLAPLVAPHRDGGKQELLFCRRVEEGLRPDKSLRIMDF